ncbi:unnamed protein product [Sphagnum jensenii]|uniref:Uncharacterized protein n=2 Tax=Sphagnum jensenii TaxID=128206 RepID=A0ABP0WIC4_9BRYO
MSMKLHTWMGFIFLSILVSCLTVKAKESLQPLIFKAPLAYPESFDWDPSHGRFLLGSITSGSIFSVSPAGNVEEFVNDDDYAGTAAVLGIRVDLPRNRVIAAVQNVNASDAPYSAVAAYELDTKKRIMFTELHHVGVQEGEKCMVNDVTVDRAGNAYLTNSYGDFVWKVTVDGMPSVFAQDTIFSSQPVVVDSSVAWWGLNGLAYHTEGYLLVVQSYSGTVFKVDLESAKVDVVNMKEQLASADGVVLQSNGALVAVSPEKAWLLESKDNWESAMVTDIIPFDPLDSITAVAIRDQYQIYVLPSFISDSIDEENHREEFLLREIDFLKESDGDDPLWIGLIIVVFILVMLAWRVHTGQLYKNKRKV